MNLKAIRKGIVTLSTVLAAAVALGLAAEPASAGVRWSDGATAGLSLRCETTYTGVRRILGYSVASDYNRPMYVQLWVWDPQSSWAQNGWVYGGGQQVGDYSLGGIDLRVTGSPTWRWVYALYTRYINGVPERWAEYVLLMNGAYSCYL